MSKMTKPKPCVAREPLLHGSRPCSRPREPSSDLCDEHQKILGRHQLIDGTLYVERPDEEDEGGDYVFESFDGRVCDDSLTVKVENRQALADLIRRAAQCLADGKPLVWSALGKMDKEKSE